MQAAKERVLLVDDEPQILTALEDLLSDDYTIFKSQTPQRALDLVREDKDIAVVITDQRMPEMNGDEFLSKIGSGSNALRIMVSGFADLPAVLRAVNEGKVFAYVTKPWEEEDLLRKVQTAAEHFRLAQELEHERRLLRYLMDNSPDGIYFKDADLRFLRANSSFARVIGAPNAEELVGKRSSEIVGAYGEASRDDLEDRNVLHAQQPVLDAVRQHRISSKRFFISETKAAIRGSSGNSIGLVGISRDVTERVEISEALRESEAALLRQTRILNSILDGMGDGVVVIGIDGTTLLFNREASRILGVPARNIAADDWPRVYGLYALDGETALTPESNPLRRAMEADALIQCDLRVRNTFVPDAFVAITATPLKDPSGAVVGTIALLRDVTEQRSLQQKFAQSQKMEAIGQLAGGVAHDFNNLLTVIVGCAELALFDTDDEAKNANLSEVLAASRRATLLTQRLLAFSRQQVIQPKEVQLNEVVSAMQSMLERLIGHGIEFSIVLRRDLSLITADQSQLEQVLLNLSINARDAMPSGGTIRIETDEESLNERLAAEFGAPPNRYVSLTVTDTGSGMSGETQKRIFEPFFTTKGPDKGTGLGLSTVYGIVRQSGAFIRVRSELGQGTEFRILFPRSTRGGQRASHRPLSDEPILARILLVEPDNSIRQIATRILRSEGHSVLEVATLGEARRHLAQPDAKIDVVFTDIGTAGGEFLAEVRALSPDTSVVFMTGGGPAMKQREDSIADDRELLPKPFSRAQLLESVQRTVHRSGSRND